MSYNTNNPVEFAMPNSAVSITAQFSPVPTTYTVTFGVSPSGAGSVTPSGTQYYPPGTVQPITASPSYGYEFSHWSVSGNISIDNPNSPSANATVNGNGSVTAGFVQGTAAQVTFYEQGLPSGVSWTVTVNGAVYSASSGQSIAVQCSGPISYTVNEVRVCTSTRTYIYSPSPSTGSASCPSVVDVTYSLKSIYPVGCS
ncbi:MAG: hypothetical protein C0167_04620 [Nitrososphaera sp.]|nr:MAG: hypothetical protein C0167_04620 [Nitrososphaera sp.]